MSKLDTAIATLNTLDVGSLDAITGKLAAVREELVRHGDSDLEEVVEKIDACGSALASGDLDEFRRLRETIVSRLGHLRVRMQ